MKRFILCLLLCGCGSDTSPGAEGRGDALDGGRSTDGGKSSRDDDSDRDADAGQSDDDDDAQEQGGNGGKDAGPADQDAGMLDDQVHCFYKSCPADGISSARMGETPNGTFLIQTVGVVYTSGFINSTNIQVIGKINGEHVILMVEAMSGTAVDHVIPPGTYTVKPYQNQNGNAVVVIATILREGADAMCSESGVAATVQLMIHEHAVPKDAFERGDPLELRGEIKITGGGWNLQAPFNIGTVCDRYIGF